MCEININECQAYPCANNALCIDGVNSFHCICKPGYTGDYCESDINECASAHCLNGGTCNDLVSAYHCTCLRGYEGKNCEQDIDECASNPCSLAGTERCEDGVNSFTCHCLPLWKGELCDLRADRCETSPCAVGASCTVVGDTFVCVCPPDFTGTLCNHRINDCELEPCLNSGTCQDGVQNFSCQCIPGLTGKMCDLNIDECASSPCANGAKCLDLINGYTCSCASGYTGELCEVDIDDCTSQPCANGGTCYDLVNQFKCTCPSGYEGKTCTGDVNECESSPCQNEATCINLQGSFQCQCLTGYSGDLCQHNPCSTINFCLNNATCRAQPGGISCLCPPRFTGVDCGKEKSGDYDLQFHGKTGSACRPPVLHAPFTSQLAICLWLRFASPSSSATVFTLSRSNISQDSQQMASDVLLVMTGGAISVSLEGEQEHRLFTVAVADGRWHHVCYQWTGTQLKHSVYLDGDKIAEEKYGVEMALPDSLQLVLGQHSETSQQTDFFEGEISQANIYSNALDESQIQSMALNCSHGQLKGDMFVWALADAYLQGHVSVVAPAVCGRSHCSPGFHGTYCNLQTDKIAPRVVSCPRDKSLTQNSAMVTVKWEEPVFEDNVGIVRIQQTHRSGQAFHQGEYLVTYVAYDAENNSAECSFEVIIRPFNCVEPPAPKNGAKVCQTWLHGSFCSVQCQTSYSFMELPPAFYTCGKLGFWDPPRGNPFQFPACTLMIEPEVTLVGVVGVQGPGCSDKFRADLKAHFTKIMTDLDSLLGLCVKEVCDFENGFSVTCDDKAGKQQQRRRKRREGESDLYHVVIHMDLPANSSAAQKTNSQWAAEEIITAIKQGHFDDASFTADPSYSHMSVDYICESGQVLREVLGTGNYSRVCLDCPEGYFYNSSASDCQLCGEGTYSNESRQFHCVPCPIGTTTNAPGSISADSCFKLCAAGSYYNTTSKQCELCPRGQYQDGVGQLSCLNCPIGQSTEHPGTTTAEQCANICTLGQEVSEDGQCQPCPTGSYQDSIEVPVCQPCPYGWTTSTFGSNSQSLCNLVVCERGHYRSEKNLCQQCSMGTYQPARGSSCCIPCGAGLTTSGPGAVSQALCYAGPVDECLLNTHGCDSHADCKDTQQGYYCLCHAGYTGDGVNCTDLCEDFCENEGVCDYRTDGEPSCNCKHGFKGSRCQEQDLVSAGLSSAVAGGIAGSVVAFIVIVIISVVCYCRHRIQQKKSHDRIYRSRQGTSLAAFYNEGYESVRDNISTPSQLIVREQSSSTSSSSTLSIAPRWNRSTFANSDEDETDACWFEPLPLDDLSLGSDAFTRTARLEAESCF